MTNSEWQSGVLVDASDYTDGVHIGKIIMADFEENIIKIDIGDNYFWEGTAKSSPDVGIRHRWNNEN